jgi:ferrous iron transport protein A
MPENPQPLASLPVGTQAIVKEINLSAANKVRLMEMGLLAGTPIELVRFAPMGDPVEIKFRGCRLMLHKHEAEAILVSRQLSALP